jgi:hypothetical protein
MMLPDPPPAGWPCPACGRCRDDLPCPCGAAGPVQVRRSPGLRGWLGWVELRDGGAAGRARLAGGRIARAEGEGTIDHAVAVPSALAPLRADAVWLRGDDLREGPLRAWWDGVFVVDGRVIGVSAPTAERLALASVAGLVGLAARGAATLRSTRRVTWEQGRAGVARQVGAPVGALVAAAPAADGPWDRWLRERLSAVPSPVEAILAAACGEAGGPDALLATLGPRLGGEEAMLLGWFADEPDAAAALVRSALIGVGGLPASGGGDQGSARSRAS